MSVPLIIAIPPEYETLRNEIERAINSYAKVSRPSPAITKLEGTALTVDFLGSISHTMSLILTLVLFSTQRHVDGNNRPLITFKELGGLGPPIAELDDHVLNHVLRDHFNESRRYRLIKALKRLRDQDSACIVRLRDKVRNRPFADEEFVCRLLEQEIR